MTIYILFFCGLIYQFRPFSLFGPAGEAFIPYYYGKAIDGIVVHQSMEYFVKPVVTLAVLAVAR